MKVKDKFDISEYAQIKRVFCIDDSEKAFLRHPQFQYADEEEICLSDDSRVIFIGHDGRLLRSWDKKGRGPGEYNHPAIVSKKGSDIYIQDDISRKVIRYDRDGNFLENWDSGPYYKFRELPDGNILALYSAAADTGTSCETAGCRKLRFPKRHALHGQLCRQTAGLPPPTGALRHAVPDFHARGVPGPRL